MLQCMTLEGLERAGYTIPSKVEAFKRLSLLLSVCPFRERATIGLAVMRTAKTLRAESAHDERLIIVKLYYGVSMTMYPCIHEIMRLFHSWTL
jgi:hypothetical protein